jgi:hypothetical protein
MHNLLKDPKTREIIPLTNIVKDKVMIMHDVFVIEIKDTGLWKKANNDSWTGFIHCLSKSCR